MYLANLFSCVKSVMALMSSKPTSSNLRRSSAVKRAVVGFAIISRLGRCRSRMERSPRQTRPRPTFHRGASRQSTGTDASHNEPRVREATPNAARTNHASSCGTVPERGRGWTQKSNNSTEEVLRHFWVFASIIHRRLRGGGHHFGARGPGARAAEDEGSRFVSAVQYIQICCTENVRDGHRASVAGVTIGDAPSRRRRREAHPHRRPRTPTRPLHDAPHVLDNHPRCEWRVHTTPST